jgi:lipoprotein-anchoring transpeptidase ErfK/SrfK
LGFCWHVGKYPLLMDRFLSHLDKLSRRDFLKFFSLGFLTLGFPRLPFSAETRGQENLPPNKFILDTALSMRFQTENDGSVFGRVVQSGVGLFDKPSFSSKQLKTLWTDVVMPITDITIGDEVPAYNRVWYNLDGQGYAHSGTVQPVQVRTNAPDSEIPTSGRLAEVTVPFTDARWWAASQDATAYRLYYATTHWVTGRTVDDSGLPLYKIYDNLIKRSYFVPAKHMRLVPSDELLPISSLISPQSKRIEVHLAEQVVIAYEYDRPVFMARAATGAHFSNGIFATPTGPHTVLYKSPTHHMASNNPAASNGYDLPGVPWISYITEDGLAFHGTYWHNDFGKPRSHGCINLSPQASRWIYLWTTPIVPPDVSLSFDPGGTAINVI